MRALPNSPDNLEAARRIIWFEEPAQALSDTYRFMAYALTYGGWDDVWMLLRCCGGKSALPELLDNAPPGIFDERSWVFWNVVAGRKEAPDMPKRMLVDVEEIQRRSQEAREHPETLVLNDVAMEKFRRFVRETRKAVAGRSVDRTPEQGAICDEVLRRYDDAKRHPEKLIDVDTFFRQVREDIRARMKKSAHKKG